MEYLSTTSLAKEMDIPSNELFAKLKGLGLIDRQGDKWVLTDAGRHKGGQTRTNPKFGEFIVWPEDVNFDTTSNGQNKRMTATTVGKHFDISAQRMNLILSELGWQEKHTAGWSVTKLGQSIGGRQLEHESGSTYVVWPHTILEDKRLLYVVRPPAEPVLQEPAGNSLAGPGFRERFPATMRTIDGHMVRSRAEMLIDNYLYQCGIVHAYERKLPIEEDCYSDFYIPSGTGRPQAVYIEFWGLEDDPGYTARKKKKLELYRKNEIPLIELNNEDLTNLDDVLARKLLKYGIKVG